MALAALADVKAYLDITSSDEDTRLSALLAAVIDQVKEYLGYNPEAGSHFERVNGNGGRFMVPTIGYPLISVDSLTVDGVTIPAESGDTHGYYITEGVLHLSGDYRFTKGYGNVKLSYQAGFALLPAAIKQGVIETVALRLKEIERLGLSSKGLAGETISYTMVELSVAVRGYLKPYRKVF